MLHQEGRALGPDLRMAVECLDLLQLLAFAYLFVSSSLWALDSAAIGLIAVANKAVPYQHECFTADKNIGNFVGSVGEKV